MLAHGMNSETTPMPPQTSKDDKCSGHGINKAAYLSRLRQRKSEGLLFSNHEPTQPNNARSKGQPLRVVVQVEVRDTYYSAISNNKVQSCRRSSYDAQEQRSIQVVSRPGRSRQDIGFPDCNPRSDDRDQRKNVQSCDYTSHIYSRLGDLLNSLR